MFKMNEKHFMFIIWGTTIVSLKTYPTVFIRNGLRDSWVAIIIASIVFISYTFYMIKVLQKAKNYSFFHLYKTAFGKHMGSLLFFMLLFAFFMILIECASIEANSMHENMLLESPPWYFLLFFVIPAIYTINKDLDTLLIVTIIGISFIMLAGINLGIQTAAYKTPSWIFPIFEKGVTSGFLLSIVQIIGLYSHVLIPIYYFQYIENKDSIFKPLAFALFIVVQMEIVSITGVIMTFSMNRITEMFYPKLLQTQLPSYFDFIEFGELLVMIQMVGGWYVKYTLTFYALLKIIKQDLNKIHPAPLYILSAFVLVISYFLSRNIFVLFNFLTFFSYFCFFHLFLIPLLAFVLFSFRQKSRHSE